MSCDRAQGTGAFRDNLRLAVPGSGLLRVTRHSGEAGLSGAQESETEPVG